MSAYFGIDNENKARSFGGDILHFDVVLMRHVAEDREDDEASQEAGRRVHSRGE